MSYKALYRKYRPQKFEEVVSQAAIIQTLQNAIISGKISHAYLFSGPRGTGKTTVARIFAKALNCENPVNGEPCCECNNCLEISEGNSPDVIEIDAASNNGVDEIRDIREKVKFLPSGAKYKIYIIDEVHMLSTGAFNALLKTLEEPPKHVIFILATTEPQKLPATIISRCQRFDFKSIGSFDISIKLKSIAEKEDSNISLDAINAISDAAEGGMRDALSILDQVISYGNKNITIEDVNIITGSISFDMMIELMNYIESKNVNFALETVNDFLNTGKEGIKIINTMLVFCRDLLLYKNIGDKNSNKYVFEKEKFQQLADKLTANKILFYIDLLCDVQNKLKLSTTPNVYIEITVIKMCSIVDADLDLMKRMSTIEEKIEKGDFISGGEGGSVDSEKLSVVDAKVNRVVTELNKLELHKLAPRLDEIEQKIDNNQSNSSQETTNDYSKELEKIKFDIENLKNDALVSNPSDGSSDDRYDDLQEQIDALKENKGSGVIIPEDITNKLNKLNEEISYLKTSQENVESLDLTNINNKLAYLEEKLDNQEPAESKENYDINALVNELNTLNEKVQELSNKPTLKVSEEVSGDTIRDIVETVEILKMEYEDLKNQSKSEFSPNNNENTVDKEEINTLQRKIDSLVKKIESIENTPKETSVVYKTIEKDDDSDLSEIKEKIQTLESRMYKFISESISSSAKNKAKPEKKPNGQIMLFGDDVIGIEDIEKTNKEAVDFGDLTKTEDEAVKDKEIEQNGFVQQTLEFDTESDVQEESKQDEKIVESVYVEESQKDNNEVLEQVEAPVEENVEQTDEKIEQSQEQNTLFDFNNEIVDPEGDVDTEETVEESVEGAAKETIEENTNKEQENLFLFDFGGTSAKKPDSYSYSGDLFNFGVPTPKQEENVAVSNEAEVSEQKVVVEQSVEKPIEKPKDIIIEQHYDAVKQEQVVTKTNSMLVTRDRVQADNDPMSVEKSLLLHEKEQKTYEKPVEQPVQEIIVGKHEEVADKFLNYDVKDIEQILFDSQSTECRNDKIRLKEIWLTLMRGIAPDLIPIINTLAKAQIKVVGNKELILTYPDVSFCNQVMRPKFKREALRVLYSKLGDTYNYIALPESVWEEKRKEYINQYYTGTKRPKLSPLVIPGLNIIDDSDEYKSRDDETINKAIEFFGSNLVKDRR